MCWKNHKIVLIEERERERDREAVYSRSYMPAMKWKEMRPEMMTAATPAQIPTHLASISKALILWDERLGKTSRIENKN